MRGVSMMWTIWSYLTLALLFLECPADALYYESQVLDQCCPRLLLDADTAPLDMDPAHAAEIELLECVISHASNKKLARMSTKADTRVALVNFTPSSIRSYAAYAAVINAAWAEHMGYSYTILGSSSGGSGSGGTSPGFNYNYEPRDPRWNKVRILEEALREALSNKHSTSTSIPPTDTISSGVGAGAADGAGAGAWAVGAQHLVWLDSDLTVLDLSLDIEALILMHPAAHILACRDPRPENGLVNTGTLVVKVSPLALQFFTEWWGCDRGAGMDQHAFDRLWTQWEAEGRAAVAPTSMYTHTHSQKSNASASASASSTQRQQKEEKEKADTCTATEGAGRGCSRVNAEAESVLRSDGARELLVAMLSPHALNSHFPAWVHQEPHHKVLHLAGMASAVRRTVFREGAMHLCRSYESQSDARSHGGSNGESDDGTVALPLLPQLGMSKEMLLEKVTDRAMAQQVLHSLTADTEQVLHHMRLRIGHTSSSPSSGQRRDEDGNGDDIFDSEGELSFLPSLESLLTLQARGRDARQMGYGGEDGKEQEQELEEAQGHSPSAAATESLAALYKLLRLVWETAAAPSFDGGGARSVGSPGSTSGNGSGSAIDPNLEKRHVRRQSYAASVLQELLDCGYNYVVFLPTSDASGLFSAKLANERLSLLLGLYEPLQTLLSSTAAAVTSFTAIGAGVSDEDTLKRKELEKQAVMAQYFEFKHWSFLAEHHSLFNDHDSEARTLQRALQVWQKMHESQWYGAGNSMHDPAREAVELYSRLGSLLCIQLVQVEQGMAALDTSLHLQLTTWQLALEPLGMAPAAGTGHATTTTRSSSSSTTAATSYIPPHALRTLLGTHLSRASCSMSASASASNDDLHAEARRSLSTVQVLLRYASDRLVTAETASTSTDVDVRAEIASIVTEFGEARAQMETQLQRLEMKAKTQYKKEQGSLGGGERTLEQPKVVRRRRKRQH